MPSASISPDGLPDATIDETGGVYTVTVTGLTGLVEVARELTQEEADAGVVSVLPPKVSQTGKIGLELLVTRAIEIAIPEGLLDDGEHTEGSGQVYMKHQLLIAQITRLVRLLLEELEPTS